MHALAKMPSTLNAQTTPAEERRKEMGAEGSALFEGEDVRRGKQKKAVAIALYAPLLQRQQG